MTGLASRMEPVSLVAHSENHPARELNPDTRVPAQPSRMTMISASLAVAQANAPAGHSNREIAARVTSQLLMGFANHAADRASMPALS